MNTRDPEGSSGELVEGAPGGRLAEGVAGRYEFTIEGVLKEAWRRTDGMKGTYWSAAAMILVLMIIIGVVLQLIFGAPQPGDMMTGRQGLAAMIRQILGTAASYPLMAGLLMMGVRRSVDLPITMNTGFAYFDRAVPLFVAGLMVSVATAIGFMLLFLPGLYLAVGYLFVVPLMVDKGLAPWEAMEASRKAVTSQWFKVFGLMLVTLIIVLISAIPLLVGLIWTWPWAVNVLGILYRQMFGVEAARNEPSEPAESAF